MSLFKKILTFLLRDPIVILMMGDWRTGKTDASLTIGYLAKKWGLVDKIGSNIYTYDNPQVEYIISIQSLKAWLHRDRSEKLFIFDEALKYAYRRKAMSQMNVDIITEVLPELSKGHARVIVCSQIEKLDSDLMHPAFCRARFEKWGKKTLVAYSKYWRGGRKFTNFPKSPIVFDPDKTAKFMDTKMSKGAPKIHGGRLYQIAKMRVDGFKNSDISNRFDIHPQQLKRDYKKILKFFVEYVDSLEDSKDFVLQVENSVIQNGA